MPDHPSPGDSDLARWRREARRAIPHADLDLIEEVAQHAHERWLTTVREGASRSEAETRAMRELHGWTGVRLAPRGARSGMPWSGWSADARYAVRSLRVRPLFTVGAILLASIGVMANVAAFAIAYGVLLRPLAYPDSERLAVVWQMRAGEQGQISFPDFADIRQASVFDGAAVLSGGRGSLRIGDAIERVNVLGVEPAGYSLLGATPFLGRLLTEADSPHSAIVISHRLWRTQLASDPNVIGRVLWLSGQDCTVVGVMAPGFDFELPITPTLRLEKHDVWSVFDRTSPFNDRRDVSSYEALVRLAPGATLAQAQAAVDAIGQRLAVDQPATNRDRSFRVAPLKQEVVASARRPLVLACAAGAVALVIALANLLTLGLLRLSDRSAELAIRQALGAGEFRLRRQLFTENIAVAATGALLGVAASVYLLHGLLANESLNLPRAESVRVDGPVLIFAAGLTLLIAISLTVLPMRLRSTETVLRGSGRVAGSRLRRTRSLTVAAQLALAVALSTGGALLGLSLYRLLGTDPGFSTSGVAAVRVSAYAARYPTMETVRAFFESIVDRVSALPGVSAVAAGSSLPLSGQTSGTSVQAEGQPVLPGSRLTAGWQFVGPGYFSSLGMTIRRGRDFTGDDLNHEGHVTVINESLARALFGDRDPVGRRVAVGGGDASGDWHEVVGVVADVRHHSLDQAAVPRVYDLFGEHWGRTLFVVVRARGSNPSSMIPTLRRTIHSIDVEAPVFEGATAEALVARSAAPRRLSAVLAVLISAAAILLAIIGVYAAASAAVAERTREIGIRAALGAAPSELWRLVLRDATMVAAAGAAAGIAGSAIAARLLSAQLFGVATGDVVLLIPAITLLLLFAAVAAVLPAARRAARIDPLIAIRLDA